MTEPERRFMTQKCAVLLQDVLVEIRGLSYQEGNARRIKELADLTHNIPEFLVGFNDYPLSYLRSGFMEYARKYHTGISPDRSRYVMLLDMDETTFNDLYRGSPKTWPEPAGAVG